MRHCPHDGSVLNAVYLAIQAASAHWTKPIRNWKAALKRFTGSKNLDLILFFNNCRELTPEIRLENMNTICHIGGLNHYQRFLKRVFDFVGALICLTLSSWLILIAFVVASIDTRNNGLFIQARIGKGGKRFNVIKIRTMMVDKSLLTTVTKTSDPRITKFGSILRKSKIDELPQLWNVIIGNMSFVGPRPDVPGFADLLTDKEKAVLSVRPGITGPATLKYRNEEELLASVQDPERYNMEVIYPDKVVINLDYIKNWSFAGDLKYIWLTIFG